MKNVYSIVLLRYSALRFLLGLFSGNVYSDVPFIALVIGQKAQGAILNQSEIRVWLDMSNQHIGILLNRDLQLTFMAFIQDLLRDCGQNPKLADIPIQFVTPIYVTNTPSFVDFGASGIILT